MIENLSNLPINWIDGMKINKTHFRDMQGFISESTRDAIGIYTSIINYGLLPAQDPVKFSFIIDNHKLLRIKAEECHAITPNGSRIEINNQILEDLSLTISSSEEIEGLQESKNVALFVCISVNPFKRIPCGEIDFEENPPRHPYTHPQYSLSIVPESRLKEKVNLGANYITIGRIFVNSGEFKIDENYIPPCVSVSSHKKLQEFHAEIDYFYGQIELYATQIAQKIFIKKQTNALAIMIEQMMDKTLNYLGLEINKFRWISPFAPPVQMLVSVTALARIVKNFIELCSGIGKEELLNYFVEWCNISQRDFENIFSEVINANYNHSQIDIIIVKIKRFMKTLTELYSALSRLDYIGKRRDGRVFISESNNDQDAIIYTKRSRTFLAD